MLLIGMLAPEQQQKKVISAKQIDKQRLKCNLSRTVFQQKRLAEELANSIDVCNTTLEQLSHKVKEEEIITALQRLQATKQRLGLPNVLNKNQSIPYVLCALQYQ